MNAELRIPGLVLVCLAALAAGGCPPAGEGPPNAAEAETFLAEADQILLERSNDEARHGWVQATYVTEDTGILYAEANERYIAAAVDLAKRSTRYFLAHILQHQSCRSLCAAAEQQGLLHRCSFYANEAAGERLQEMLAMGASRPWPDALEAITGTRQMDATAILDYFAPLASWLEEQNSGRQCGW